MMLSLELLGGIGLFLLGMSMTTGGLKIAAGDGLRTLLRRSTRTPSRGLAAGTLLTAIMQSSSAVTVATIGFVNAGLLTLAQAVWVIYGANIGTTMTGWLVAMIGLKLDIVAISLPIIGAGMLVRLFARSRARLGGFGEALAGFGLFFLGIGVLKEAFSSLIPYLTGFDPESAGLLAPFVFLILGMILSMMTQSSSAAIAITLTAAATGSVPIHLAAATIIGADMGTTSTAAFAAVGATPNAKRVAAAQILFNIASGTVAFVLLPVFLGFAVWLTDWVMPDAEDTIALAAFHTTFNIAGVILYLPFAKMVIDRLENHFVSPDEAISRPQFLDTTLAEVPSLALRGLVLETHRMLAEATGNAIKRLQALPAREGDGAHDAGIVALGQMIRDFVAELSRSPLPPEVVQAIPDVIRCVQHIEEVSTESAETLRSVSLPDMQEPAWARLRAGVLAALTTSTEDPATFKTEFDTELSEVESAYQAIKYDLLTAVARGSLKVGAAESALMTAQRMRQIAESALKAERRIAPWIPLAQNLVTASQPAAEAYRSKLS